MNKTLVIQFNFNEDLGLASLQIIHNDTGLDSDSLLIKHLGVCLIKSVNENQESLVLQDLLNATGIGIDKTNT